MVGFILPAVIGAGASIFGASQAASAQTAAADKATAAQLQMFETARKALEPYTTAGEPAANKLMSASSDPYFTSPVTMTQADLEATPGYQFVNYQGQKAVQNSYAARGLGSSGAAMKGAASYATGLADTTYQTQYQIAQDQRNQIYNRLYNTASLGANAAAGVGSSAVQTGQSVGSNIIGAGNAAAGAWTSAGNTAATLGNQIAGYNYMQPYMNRWASGG